jgi:hypothetical protein
VVSTTTRSSRVFLVSTTFGPDFFFSTSSQSSKFSSRDTTAISRWRLPHLPLPFSPRPLAETVSPAFCTPKAAAAKVLRDNTDDDVLLSFSPV